MTERAPNQPDCLVLLIVKRPEAGRSKTRLGRDVGMERAADFAECLLKDHIALLRETAALAPRVQPGISFLPRDAEGYFRTLAREFELIAQEGDDLGARLDNALRAGFARGYRHAAVLSSDTPLARPADIVGAFGALDGGADVAFGTCSDGGWYLMAVSAPQPALLRPIPMSTPETAAHTLKAIAAQRLKLHALPETQDVDELSDLIQLRNRLQSLPAEIAPFSRQWLHTHLP